MAMPLLDVRVNISRFGTDSFVLDVGGVQELVDGRRP
jgi:hypothetical protein